MIILFLKFIKNKKGMKVINLIIFFILFNLINNNTNVNISKNSNNINNISNTYIGSKKSLYNKKNLILGIIQNYSLNVILPFFKSLIRANFKNCDVVMFVRNVSLELRNYLKSIGILVYKITKQYKNISIIKLRWKMYLDFLKEKREHYIVNNPLKIDNYINSLILKRPFPIF